jgi:hypothetical protein
MTEDLTRKYLAAALQWKREALSLARENRELKERLKHGVPEAVEHPSSVPPDGH